MLKQIGKLFTFYWRASLLCSPVFSAGADLDIVCWKWLLYLKLQRRAFVDLGKEASDTGNKKTTGIARGRESHSQRNPEQQTAAEEILTEF